MSVKRYSGRATIALRLVERDDRDQFVYHYNVIVGRKSLSRGEVYPPRTGFGRGVAYDSAKAYDEVASAAISFAIDDNSDVGNAVGYAESGTGYVITRRKPVRSAVKNGRSRLKRTKLACTRRSNATRKGSSKAASRLSTHCPKRRSRKAR